MTQSRAIETVPVTLTWVKADTLTNAVILEVLFDAIGVDDDIFATDQVHGLGWIVSVRNLIVEKRVLGPVEMSLDRIRHANFRGDKVV